MSQSLTELANKIHACPASDTATPLALYQDYARRALSADAVIWLAAYAGEYGRECWKTELLDNWKVVDIIYPPGLNNDVKKVQAEYLKLARKYGVDPMTERAIQTAGSTRVLYYDDADSAIHWKDHPTRKGFTDWRNIGERMLGVYHLHAQAESYLLIDRIPGSPPFDARDKQTLYRLLMEFPRLHYWLALERGLIPPASRPIIPRYQQIIRLMHSNLSETEMAEQLGLSRGTVHSYIIEIYKNFKVNSRAELLQLWSAAIPA